MAISTIKKKLLAECKELGLNVDTSLSSTEIQKKIDEFKEKNKKPAEQKPSQRRGEY